MKKPQPIDEGRQEARNRANAARTRAHAIIHGCGKILNDFDCRGLDLETVIRMLQEEALPAVRLTERLDEEYHTKYGHTYRASFRVRPRKKKKAKA